MWSRSTSSSIASNRRTLLVKCWGYRQYLEQVIIINTMYFKKLEKRQISWKLWQHISQWSRVTSKLTHLKRSRFLLPTEGICLNKINTNIWISFRSELRKFLTSAPAKCRDSLQWVNTAKLKSRFSSSALHFGTYWNYTHSRLVRILEHLKFRCQYWRQN